MEKTFKVALIGCGTIANNHFVSISLLKNCDIVAVCDVKRERAEQYANEFAKDAKIYTDYILMLDSEELDAVHVCTPHYLHARMTIEALNRNINVFLEKPMCISLSEIDEMLLAEKNSKARAAVCFQNRFNDAYLYTKDLIEKSGEKFGGYATVFWYRNEKYYTESDWRGKLDTEGGGVMINQAIHTLDMLISLLGEPVSVTATTANHHLKDVIEVEDTSEGVIEFENGSRANFYVTTAAPDGDRICIVLKSKSYRIEMRGFDLYVNGEKISFPETVSYLGKEYYGARHPEIIASFYKAIETGDRMPVTLESASKVIKLILAVYNSRDNKIMI